MNKAGFINSIPARQKPAEGGSFFLILQSENNPFNEVSRKKQPQSDKPGESGFFKCNTVMPVRLLLCAMKGRQAGTNKKGKKKCDRF